MKTIIHLAPALLLATALPLSAAEKILRWTEVREIDGRKVTLTGKQIIDPGSGSQETFYLDETGNPLPDSFVRANQKRWNTGAAAAASEVSPPREATPRPVPTAVRHNIMTVSASVTLPAPDMGPILDEDARNTSLAKGSRRIGFFRALPRAVTPRKWTALPDGSHIWSFRIVSPGAEAIRVRLKDLSLPAGAQIVQYATDNTSESYGPYDTGSLHGEGTLWTESTFSSDVTVECTIPPGAKTADVRFAIDRIVHVYVKLGSLAPAKESFCHNDVTCYPEWAAAASGVAGLGTIGQDGFIFCTGCLMADVDPSTTINYFMTANHCVANQSEASTLEFYWFYQTSTCNGAVPNVTTVPRTSGGADYLAGMTLDAGSDFAFLKLRSNPPGGTTLVGWSTATPTTSETLTGIHHPDGAYKRISFSHFKGYEAGVTHVQWYSGVTEPGSSGSPLFNAAQQFIGQLYGGRSYCRYPQGIDDYGRFDVTYPVIAGFLGSSVPAPMLSYEDPRDYDGDGRADLAVYHPAASMWYIGGSSAGLSKHEFGFASTAQVVGDFDGDGRTDLCIYHAPSGDWYILATTAGFSLTEFGFPGTLPVPADYDGDGRTDIAVFDPLTGNWYLNRTTAGFVLIQFGFSGVVPVPGDYDGDGASDLAVYDPNAFDWYILRSTDGFLKQNWGYGAVIPAPADYDGDGKRDIAVYDSGTTAWYLLQSQNGSSNVSFGAVGGFVAPGDYDNDGRDDLATYKLSTGTWLIRKSSGGVVTNQFGWSEAPPVGLRP